MKVRELIEALEECDPDATVLLMSQINWPMEYSISGVTERERFSKETPENGGSSDVFLCEGSQIRYGDSSAWDAC